VLKHDKEGLSRIEKRLKEKCLKDVVYTWLSTLHDSVPQDFLENFKKAKRENLFFQKSIWYQDEDKVKQEVEKEFAHFEPFINVEDEDVKRRRITLLFISCYKYDDKITRYSNLIDSLIGFEESLILWKTRHARMVERMIGKRIGTGGSSGVEYLDKTTEYRVFGDLWQVRNHYIRPSSLPKLNK
jgi:tryptophan 2,3-dioxygenase